MQIVSRSAIMPLNIVDYSKGEKFVFNIKQSVWQEI